MVDSSVGIDFLNGRRVAHVAALQSRFGRQEILVGDLMLREILQGVDGEQAADAVERLMRTFDIVPMVGEATAIAAARNFRALRRQGITVRKTIDLSSEHGASKNRRQLLHHDSDFRPMPRHLD